MVAKVYGGSAKGVTEVMRRDLGIILRFEASDGEEVAGVHYDKHAATLRKIRSDNLLRLSRAGLVELGWFEGRICAVRFTHKGRVIAKGETR